MSDLNPDKLHVDFKDGVSKVEPVVPRAYTLTHSDRTGDLFLTIAQKYDKAQIAGWYTRLMRDEVLARWDNAEDRCSLHVHCHVSGGLVVGSASWRESILRRHMRMVLESFRLGDSQLFEAHPELDDATIWVHFHMRNSSLDKTEDWGKPKDYRL